MGQNFDFNKNLLSLGHLLQVKRNLFKVWFYTPIFMILYMYTVPGQRLTTSRDEILMSTGTSCHFGHLLKIYVKSLRSLILYIFHDLIHVYSPAAGADSRIETKFWCQQKGLITLPICCQFQKNLFQVWLYTFFHDLIHVHSPGQGADSPQGTKFLCQQKLLVTSVICC